MSYALDHADALADITEAGSAVTFTLTSPGTHNAATGTFSSPTTATVAGYAIETRADPVRYLELGLSIQNTISLLFAPATYGSLPSLGYSVTWGGSVYVVKEVGSVAPDGTAIMARIIASR